MKRQTSLEYLSRREFCGAFFRETLSRQLVRGTLLQFATERYCVPSVDDRGRALFY